MQITLVRPEAFSRTFTMIARPDTHFFLDHELPEFLDKLSSARWIPFRNYVCRLRSGEYIQKASYADTETNYVYLRIGQFSGDRISFEDLAFLDESVGREYADIRVHDGDLVITRSGTVGVVHMFEAPDDKVYIPSHHLAVVEMPQDTAHSPEYLRLFLQTRFARKYFWAFATGKDQKEISNWSIKSIPIPQCDDPHTVAEQCEAIERELEVLREKMARKETEKEAVFIDAIRHAT